MIKKKRIPKKKTKLVLPSGVIKHKTQSKIENKKKQEEKRIEDIKRYKRSLNRIFIAKYIEINRGIPFLDICEGMEAKNSKILKLIKEIKQELVYEKFGVEEDESCEEE